MATDTGTGELSDTAGGEHNRLKTLGKYRIQRRIGAGGMGTVFLAVDDSLNRTVALKVLPKDRAENPTLVRRFKAEGQAAAHLEHPNIVRVFEAGEADGFLYMALEYVEGIDVYELVERRGVIPVKRSTDIIRQTALALQHAYEKGIVHRDIKPSNLLIKRDGSVKLADMGLARSVDDTLETNITRAGTTVGTVDYMSPEQARDSKAADVRSDIYSLGCTWYHMLTGHPPFPQGSMTNKLQAHAVSTRPDPRGENDRVPEGIVAIIQRMMAIKPDDRHQTPHELLDDLEATGKMHRNVDESALAALANESGIIDDADVAEAEEVDEPDLRMADDVDDFDLSSLKESGEYELEPPVTRPKPVKPKSTEKRTQRSQSRRADVEPVAEDDVPADESGTRRRPTKGGSGQTIPEQRAVPATSDREAHSPAASDPEAPARRSKTTKKRTKPESPTKSDRARRPKKRSVTTADGQAPTLPGKEAAQPVDGSTKKGINLDAFKFVIPAVLVVAALAAVGYAIIHSGDGFGTSGGTNPYADGRQDSDLPVAVARPHAAPDPALVEDTPGAAPRVEAVPFPGAEDDAETSDQKALVPEWVNAFRTSSGRASRSLIVRRRPAGRDEVGTINAALQKLPRGGGTIEIDGDGPFPLEALDIRNMGPIRLQAAEGRQPVIQLRPAADWTSGPLLTFRGTQVELNGLHFILADAGPKDASLFNIVGGNVSLRNCSITIDRHEPAPMTALRIDGTAGSLGVAETGKCLLENAIIRGPAVTSIGMHGSAGDLVAGNCLLVSGSAPTIVVTDTGGETRRSGVAPPTRGIRLFATTIISSGSALELTHQSGSGDAVSTEVITRRSLLAMSSAADTDETSSMATFHGWPTGPGGLGNSHVSRLTWLVEQGCFAGWPQLLMLFDGTGAPLMQVAAASDEWRKFWNQGLSSEAIRADAVAVGPPGNVTPGTLHEELATLIPPLKDGHLPGFRPDQFPSLPTGLLSHVVAATRQPYEPAWLGAGMVIKGDPVRFDLSMRRSLPHYLASEGCADGTHVIAFGSGLKEFEPIIIENKAVRLEFESTGKSPLLVQPKATREGAPAEEAFVTVRHGTLDLVNISLKMPTSRTFTYPKSAILLDDASLAIRNGRLEGPRGETKSAAALIRSTTGGPGGAQRGVLVENSFLVSLYPLMSGPVQWQSLIARNTVLVSGGDAISVDVATADQLPAAVVLDHCTIVAGGVAVRTAVAAVAAANDPLSVFARASVFAGPIDGNSQSSAVVAHSPGAAENRDLVWWGSANGFSNRLTGYRIDGSAKPGDFKRDWTAAWGPGHEANPLTGAADVLFTKSLPDLQLIEPSSLRLSDTATAATWGPALEPIGAVIDEIGPVHTEADPKTPQGKSPPRPGATPGTRNPGF